MPRQAVKVLKFGGLSQMWSTDIQCWILRVLIRPDTGSPMKSHLFLSMSFSCATSFSSPNMLGSNMASRVVCCMENTKRLVLRGSEPYISRALWQ